ncbi:AraC family transcriptional regulator N-terminal domain-containing protein [Streptomyces sp. NPDC101149]|uniref:AraC family transcriptional regulator n=1 Tax=Streptomyces sp. NPDC101149 TaxID=3366113 RepID=UPI00381F8B48
MLILEHVGDDGRMVTIADGVGVAVVDEPTPPVTAAMPGPTLAIVAAGVMRTVLNGEPYEYGAGKYVIASHGLPSTSHVLQADPDEPLAIFIMALRPQAIASLLLETTDTPASPAQRELAISDATPKLLDPVVRLLRAARYPDDLRVLGPSYQREILWRLLTGDQGALARQIAQADNGLAHITRAIGWIREHYHEPLSIAALARLCGMSPSSFHRHFRAVTAATPLQFQKTIRLQTARTLLWTRSGSVADIAHRVGYESTSQFNREYRKKFGTSPGRDTPTHRPPGQA